MNETCDENGEKHQARVFMHTHKSRVWGCTSGHGGGWGKVGTGLSSQGQNKVKWTQTAPGKAQDGHEEKTFPVKGHLCDGVRRALG